MFNKIRIERRKSCLNYFYSMTIYTIFLKIHVNSREWFVDCMDGHSKMHFPENSCS